MITVGKIKALLVLVLLVAVHAHAAGIDDMSIKSDGNEIALTTNYPILAGDVDPKPQTLSGQVMAAVYLDFGRTRTVVSLPYYLISFDDAAASNQTGVFGSSLDEAKSAFGNMYFGIEYDLPKTNSFGEVGLWVPINSSAPEKDAAMVLGQMSHPLYLEPVFLGDWSLCAAYNRMIRVDKKIKAKTRFGSSIINPEKFTLVFGEYSGMFWTEANHHRFAAGIEGRLLLNHFDDLGLWDTSLHQLSFKYWIEMSNLQPSIALHVPLNSNARDYVFSSLEISIKRKV